MKTVKMFKTALRQALSMFVVMARLFNKRCPKCKSKNTKVVFKTQHPYCKEGIMMTTYECKSCWNVWS